MLDALEVYLEQKGNGKAKSFGQSAERACGYVIENCGNKPLAAYTRQDALVFRDWLVARGLTGSSVTRNFSYVKAVINFALSEFALDVRNPFVGVYHDRSKGVVTRNQFHWMTCVVFSVSACRLMMISDGLWRWCQILECGWQKLQGCL